jgi:hypothetical protein
MSTANTTVHSTSHRPTPVYVTVYHNHEAHFERYQHGQLLTAVTSHWVETTSDDHPVAIAEWAYRTFNADLDVLEAERHTPGGETSFLAACVYRLLGHRSLSVGDVVHIDTRGDSHWLACEPATWRPIRPPTRLAGTALTAGTVYRHMADQRTAR